MQTETYNANQVWEDYTQAKTEIFDKISEFKITESPESGKFFGNLNTISHNFAVIDTIIKNLLK